MRLAAKNFKSVPWFADPALLAGRAGERAECARICALLLGAAVAAPMSGAVAQPAPAAAQEPSPLEQFKRFVSSPPVIKNLVFQKKVPMAGGVRPLDGSFAQSTRFDYFQARWQTNGVLLRPMSSPDDVSNFTVAGHLISWSGRRHALWEPDWFFTTWDDRDPSVAGQEFSIFYTSQFYLGPLQELMNFGVLFAGIGTVRWDGNHFRAECDVDHQHLRITGEVAAAADGRPDYVRVRYQWPNQTFNHLIRYNYVQPLISSAFLPRLIRDFWIPGNDASTNDAMEVNEWRILDLELADKALDSRAFDAEPFARQNLWKRRVYKNSGLYIQHPDGTLQFTGTLGLQNPNLIPPKVTLGLFYAGWGGLNIAIFVLMVRARAKKEHATEG